MTDAKMPKNLFPSKVRGIRHALRASMAHVLSFNQRRSNFITLLWGVIALYGQLITHAYAAQPLTNGDFETGSLSAWTSESTNGARVQIVDKGSCFSINDTTKIKVRGQHSALLRSNGEGKKGATAILRSDAFAAGDGIAFISISETSLTAKGKEPTKLSVEILDASDNSVLVSQIFSTGQAKLNASCPSLGEAGHFSPHYFSTREFVGQNIKLQFKQNTRVNGNAFFTLIDQIILFNQGEQPSFRSRPHAQAGMEVTSFGTPMLSSRGSFDSDQKLFKLAYTWYLGDDELKLRNPCIADIENGNHNAILYVNDGHHALSDSVSFFVNQLPNPIATTDTGSSGTTTTGSTDTLNTDTTDTTSQSGNNAVVTVSDPECDVEVPSLDGNSPDVPVNDPDNLFVNTAEQNIVDNLSTPADQRNNQSSSSTSSPSSSESPSTSTSLTRGALDLQASGIVFKPVSEGNGNLVVLTPSDTPNQTVRLIRSNGDTIETSNFVGRTNGDRATYRFNRPGSAYSLNIILRVGSTDYLVQNPALRVN